MQVQAVCFTDLRYLISQLGDPLFDRILHDNRLAGHAELGSDDCHMIPRKLVWYDL